MYLIYRSYDYFQVPIHVCDTIKEVCSFCDINKSTYYKSIVINKDVRYLQHKQCLVERVKLSLNDRMELLYNHNIIAE